MRDADNFPDTGIECFPGTTARAVTHSVRHGATVREGENVILTLDGDVFVSLHPDTARNLAEELVASAEIAEEYRR